MREKYEKKIMSRWMAIITARFLTERLIFANVEWTVRFREREEISGLLLMSVHVVSAPLPLGKHLSRDDNMPNRSITLIAISFSALLSEDGELNRNEHLRVFSMTFIHGFYRTYERDRTMSKINEY